MKTPVAALALAGAALLMPALAQASAWTIDTGTPQGGGFALALDATDAVAALLGSGYGRVDAIQAFVDGGSAGETFTITLYDALNGRPADDPLYATTARSGDGAGWYGVSGLGWLLDASAPHWVAIEMSATDTLGGGAGGLLPVGVDHPLAATAFNDGSGYRVAAPRLDFGLRVSAVPEPGMAGLLVLGLAALGLTARRRAR